MNAPARRLLAFAPVVTARAERAELPEPAPLDMPVQALDQSARRRRRMAPGAGQEWRALMLGGASLALTAPATATLATALGADGLSALDLAVLAVFAMLFAWSAFAFFSAVAGFAYGEEEEAEDCLDPAHPLPQLATRTAILAPIYNEDTQGLFARLAAIAASLAETGQAQAFDLFILSDTTRAEVQAEERTLMQRLRARSVGPEIYYRHRAQNTDRKAGNIADWVREFGGAYPHMVVLDADSLMSGETLVRLAGAMERNRRLGLIQTLPTLINLSSLFARAQQFASRMYGPILARGVAWWSGPQGNYWGHNAILRTQAFADQAGLPHLPGRKPFGGHILSHDFVEAALLRRAGWEVRMAPRLTGSYEESPPTLADLIARDRRWCQGNLQHALVMRARGLHWISRLHLFRGFTAYLTSPLWLALIVMGLALELMPRLGAYAAPAPSAGELTRQGGVLAALFAFSMLLAVAPKIMACAAMLRRPETRRAFGGVRRALAGLACEIALSALVAPVIMLNQVRALAAILAGRDSGWPSQSRAEGALSWAEAARRHGPDSLAGLALALAALVASPAALLWLSPVIVGLLSAIPLAVVTSRRDLGLKARRAGLFLIPEETAPPPVISHVSALMAWPPEPRLDHPAAWLLAGGKVEPLFG